MIDGILLTERLEAREVECHPIDMRLGKVMPEATRAAEFEAKNKGITFTTRKAGTGLGLAIARRAVEAQGGRIGVDSSAGRGCHFWLTFPKRTH